MRLAPIAVTALAALLAISPGCNPFRRQRQPKVPPPVSPAPLPPKPEAEPAPRRQAVWWEFPPPPEVAPAPPASIPPPPIQPEFRTRPPRRERGPVAATAPEGEAEAPKAPPVPRLTQLLSPEEQRQYNREIDEALDRAHRNVALIAQRPLNSEQQVLLERVNAFLQQTVELRQVDLVTARSLAQRADLLARDLERSTR
jgi:hypothetical protein